jgi:hypothetical protein
MTVVTRRGGIRRENEARSTLRTGEFNRAEHGSARASATRVRPASRMEVAADLPRPGRLRSQFEPTSSERTVEGLSTRINRCPSGLEVRQICAFFEATHVGTRDVPSTRDRFRFGDGIHRYQPSQWRTRISDDWRSCTVRKVADRRTGEVGFGKCPGEGQIPGTSLASQAVAHGNPSAPTRANTAERSFPSPSQEVRRISVDRP